MIFFESYAIRCRTFLMYCEKYMTYRLSFIISRQSNTIFIQIIACLLHRIAGIILKKALIHPCIAPDSIEKGAIKVRLLYLFVVE